MISVKRIVFLCVSFACIASFQACKMEVSPDPEKQVAAPTFNPGAGSFDVSQNVTISCATSGAVIRYTTDGGDPTPTSTLYQDAISIDKTTTLKAKAWKDGMTESAVVEAAYTKNAPGVVSTPAFGTPGGFFTGPVLVGISCSTTGAVIRYTIDGSEPSESSTEYTTAISVATTRTIKAKAWKTGMTESASVEATYVITGQLKAPAFSPSGGTYTTAQSVSITCESAGATIRYTTDGSEPSEASAEYTGPVSVAKSETVKAKAFKANWIESETSSATYTVTGKVSMPVISPTGGEYTEAQTVTISCASAGATVRYTTDGSEPSAFSAVYSGAVGVTKSLTVKAKAWLAGWDVSDTASATFSIGGVTADVGFSVNGGSYTDASLALSLSCGTAGSTVYYTIDGTTPTTASTAYAGPIAITATTTVKAFARRAGFTDSAVTSNTYTMAVAPPEISLLRYDGASSSVELSGTCATEKAVIRYTTDGSDPDETSTGLNVYYNMDSYEIESVSMGSEIRFRAFYAGRDPSPVITKTIELVTLSGTIATPLPTDQYQYEDTSSNFPFIMLLDGTSGKCVASGSLSVAGTNSFSYSIQVMKSEQANYLYCILPMAKSDDEAHVGYYGGSDGLRPDVPNVSASSAQSNVNFSVSAPAYPVEFSCTLDISSLSVADAIASVTITITDANGILEQTRMKGFDTADLQDGSVTFTTRCLSGNKKVTGVLNLMTSSGQPQGIYQFAPGATSYFEATDPPDLLMPDSGTVSQNMTVFSFM